MPTTASEHTPLTKADFVSGQDVRWCPGCGDYAILNVMQKVMPEIGISRENIVFVSGIGCSSRFPYYMNTYGFHSIHGRAPTIATGLKIANPDLSVWVITGDGDGLSIGGNHLLHALRRNIDVNIILFNNRIYGLTKGQYSPTSRVGSTTKSSPDGSIDGHIQPLSVALASEATFVARAFDTDIQNMSKILKASAQHRGTSFIEIFQNCPVFNDKAFEHITGRESRSDNSLFLQDGKPLIFGKDKNRGIVVEGLSPKVIEIKDDDDIKRIMVHKSDFQQPHYAYMLTQLSYPEFPVPFGIFRQIEKPSYERLLHGQIQTKKQKAGTVDLNKLLYSGDVWTNEGNTSLTIEDKEYLRVPVGEERVLDAHGIQKAFMESLIRDCLPQDSLHTISHKATMVEAAQRFRDLSSKVAAMVVVDDDDTFIGILAERDMLLHCPKDPQEAKNITVKKMMIPNRPNLEYTDTINYAVHMMSIGVHRSLAIYNKEHDNIMGIVHVKDILRHLDEEISNL